MSASHPCPSPDADGFEHSLRADSIDENETQGPSPLGNFDVLALDPRHTGVNHLSEVALLQHVGALQWRVIAERAGMRMRDLHATGGRPVYASFYYVGLQFPLARPISSHRIDDRLGISSSIRLFGDTMVDGFHQLWQEDELGEGLAESSSKGGALRALEPGAGEENAWVRMSNVFVAKKGGASQLEVCSPVNLDPRKFPRSPVRFDTYQKVKHVRTQPGFTLPLSLGPELLGESVSRIPINPDRDINGVGLVYFANYVTFLDTAERVLLGQLRTSEPRIRARSLVQREIAYFANAEADDALEVRVRAYSLQRGRRAPLGFDLLYFDFLVHRCSDGRLVCASTAKKLLQTS